MQMDHKVGKYCQKETAQKTEVNQKIMSCSKCYRQKWQSGSRKQHFDFN